MAAGKKKKIGRAELAASSERARVRPPVAEAHLGCGPEQHGARGAVAHEQAADSEDSALVGY